MLPQLKFIRNGLKFASDRKFLKKTFQFFGFRVFCLLSLSIVCGLSLFLVEYAFAFAIQAFLLALGVAQRSGIWIPDWIPSDRIEVVLGFLFVLAVARGALQGSQQALEGMSQEVFKALQRKRILAWAFSQRSGSVGAISSLFGERVTWAGLAIMFLQRGVVLGTLCIMIGLSLFWLSPMITLVASLCLGMLAIPMRILTRKISSSGHGLVSQWDKTNSRLLMSLKNLILLRIYGIEKIEEERSQEALGRYLNYFISFHKSSGLLVALPQGLGVAVICLITLLGQGPLALSPGELVSYFYLFIRVVQNFSGISQVISSFLFHWPQLAEVANWWIKNSHDSVLASVPKQVKKVEVESKASQPIAWKIEKMDFHFPETVKSLFYQFSLSVAAGETVVVMGPSGAGKSTLLALMLGELSPTGGEVQAKWGEQWVTLDENTKRPLLQVLGYVGPESYLIEGTVKTNLIFGLNRTPTSDEIEVAIQKSECGFIYDFPKGLDHQITEQGQGLSAGQKQRLSLARALLRNPKALILDEATANLDETTEKKLIETFRQLKGQMTIIAVTHRSGFLSIADQVVRVG